MPVFPRIPTRLADLPGQLGSQQVSYLTLDFEDQYLQANRDYGFMLRFASGSGGQSSGLEANVFAMGAYSYDDGAAFIYSGNWSGTILNNELVFFLHGRQVNASPLLGDTNVDFAVDLLDYAQMAGNWEAAYEPPCCGPDVTCDGWVNIDDLYFVARNWLERL